MRRKYHPPITLLFIMLSLCLAACSGDASGKMKPVAAAGVMDLTGWDLESKGMIDLNGEWEFYWGQLLSPGDFLKKGGASLTGMFSMPGIWNEYEVKGKRLSGDGYATFRLVVKTAAPGGLVGLRLMDMGTAYRLYVNGRDLVASGRVGRTADEMVPQWLPKTVLFEKDAKELELVLQISNFRHRKGGMWDGITMGTAAQIAGERAYKVGVELFLLGSLIIMSIYHFGLYFLRRKETSALFYGVFCLLISLRIIFTGEILMVHLFPSINWEIEVKIEYLTVYLANPMFVTFISSLYPHEMNRGVVRVIQALGVLFSLFTLATPVRIFSHAMTWFQIIVILGSSLFVLYGLVRAIIKGREGAIYAICGFIFAFLTIINDILYNNLVIHTGYLMPLGFFVFIFAQSYNLSHRFARTFTEVEAMSERLLSLDKLKDEFLANTSHELRTPLNGIIGIAESMIDGAAGEMTPEQASNLSMIATSGRRLTSLVNDILDFSKMKRRDIELNIRPVDIGSVCNVVIMLSRSLIGHKEIRIINSIGPGIPPVDADEDRVQQIMHNLIGNAIKFTDAGFIEVSARVVRGLVEISVSDTGIGIPPEKKEHVFESFEQADGTVSREYSGAGLGLSITKQLVDLQGGSIRVVSEPGRGSTFTFTLPVSSGAAETPREQDGVSRVRGERVFLPAAGELPYMEDSEKSAIDSLLPAGDDYQILAVDDEPINLQVISNFLSRENFHVTRALSGIEALELFDRGATFDLVILDIMMPRMSGYEVCKALRVRFSLFDLPILILTAKNQILDLVTGFEAGANDYVSKPFDKRELLARVNTLLTLKQAVKEHNQLKVIQQELDIARRIQKSILPGDLPRLPGLDMQVRYHPMTDIGGDFYDFHLIDSNRVGVIMADVTGHGIPAALIAAMVKVAFSMQKQLSDDPGQVLTRICSVLSGKLENQFLSAAYVYLDLDRMKLLAARAGHPPLYLWKKREQKLMEIMPRGCLIGWQGDTIYHHEERDIEPGDRVILYTDGIVETRNASGILFGEEQFLRLIEEGQDLAAPAFADYILEFLTAWSGDRKGFEDDLTLLVMDVLPG